jgi:hypothetical protein
MKLSEAKSKMAARQDERILVFPIYFPSAANLL